MRSRSISCIQGKQGARKLRRSTSMARPSTMPAGLSGTLTLTINEPSSSLASSSSSRQSPSAPTETLVLRLKRPKKKVTWKEGTVDNEFLQKKSSKKCCIFHKQKPFDEDDSDEEEDGSHSSEHGGGRPRDDGAGPSGCCSHGADHRST